MIDFAKPLECDAGVVTAVGELASDKLYWQVLCHGAATKDGIRYYVDDCGVPATNISWQLLTVRNVKTNRDKAIEVAKSYCEGRAVVLDLIDAGLIKGDD